MSVWAMCAVGAAFDTVELARHDVPIDGVITLEADEGRAAWCSSRGLDAVEITDYALTADGDRRRLLQIDMDLLLVLGWQRLIPAWLLEHPRFGCIGTHGSPWGITGGRGRSPQNWALILGAPEFHISIFRLDEGVDSGALLDTRSFSYTPRDDIATSYAKASYLQAQMLRDGWRAGTLLHDAGRPQETEPRYLPRRRPGDGGIDWRRSATEVDRFIRALTRPYPGAHVDLGTDQWKIWRATPIDLPFEPGSEPGEVLHLFDDGRTFIRCGEGAILIEDATPAGWRPSVGSVLPSSAFDEQMRAIVARHVARYPQQVLIDDFAAYS